MATATKKTAPVKAPPKSNVPAKTPPKRGTAVAKGSDRGEQLPAFMQDDIGRGVEKIGLDDIGTPRLKLMQGLSPELQQFNDLRAGMFFHGAQEFIFDGPVLAVPVYYHKRYILWRPLEDGGGILARADDAIHWSPSKAKFEVKLDKKDGGHRVTWETAPTVRESGLADWGSSYKEDPNSQPAATLMYEYVLVFPEHPELAPAVLTFQRASVKKAKTGVNDKLRLGRAPIFGRLFEFTPFEDTNSVGQKFYNIQPNQRGLVTDEDLYNQCKELNSAFETAGLRVRDEEGLQHEGATIDDTPGGGKY